ncbi:MAG: peptidoglycan DD-metalloendopeptidase family protein [Acidobacteria bacterium]|nr:peptidoglycan DD-metalloendopeptidase family protein [Acidobacteriota bacterium]
MRRLVPLLLAVILVAATGGAADPGGGRPDELAAIRARIGRLERRLGELDRQTAGARQREQRLDAKLELARARVQELEALLSGSRDEILRLRKQAVGLAGRLRQRRRMLGQYLAMASLLGDMGPAQLLFDALRGGHLAEASGTVAVLTKGQLRLTREYAELEQRYRSRLGELSVVLNRAQAEAVELEKRRRELEGLRVAAARERQRLEHQRTVTENRLEEYQQREAALERLMKVLAGRKRLTGQEDIHRYRGALPWPARGKIVETFGRHRLRRYATYTVCNGLRLKVPAGTRVRAVFPGVVAYARYFKGYGNMVVIDHGHQVYSLVAGLATIFVRPDQNVSMGTALGLTPPPGDTGNLYVEIREKGHPQDPRSWLRLKEAAH